MKQLINPHAHSDYSLDGAAKVEEIVLVNKRLGATHVALTEHGNLNSAAELYEKAHKHGIKPIIGIEVYLQPFFEDELRLMIEKELEVKGKLKDVDSRKKADLIEKELYKEYFHLTVHFRDEWAYNYFTELTPKMESRAIVKFGERKPIITLEELAGAAGHITVCSGCLVGAVSKWLLPRRGTGIRRPDLAEKAYHLVREITGKEYFFVEIFPHKTTHTWQAPTKESEGRFIQHECTDWNPDGDLQKVANSFVLDLARKNGDSIIISLDSHFATPNQKIVQDARLGNGQEQWKFYNSYHVLSSEEAYGVLQQQLGLSLKEFESYIDNSYRWASLFDYFKMTTNKDRWVLPPLPDNFQELLVQKINQVGRMDWSNAEMVQRLKYEISVLTTSGKVNLLPYFFTVEDLARFCRESDILINVRGSAGGSLLLYVLGVSAVNPLKHGLSFERFLTAGRIKANTLPDVDIDVADQAAVMKYLQDKYQDAFCRISVDVGLKLKSSIKDAERAVLGKVRAETERLCVTLPKPVQGLSEEAWVFGYEDDTGKHPGILETYPPLKQYAAKNPQIWSVVEEMLGIIRQKSQHACGVVIADKPVQSYVPITYIGHTRVTGFSPKSLEYVGLVKYDILGLNTLRDIKTCLDLLRKRDIIIDPFNLPPDPAVFELFHRGDTFTVFQFDTDTVRPYLKAIKPNSIDDLAAVTALCRPGTLDAPSGVMKDGKELSLAELYVLRAQKQMPVEYIHPDLAPIMSETYGIQLYQEQTLRIFRDIAGYTYEQAEAVRRGIGKKDEAVLASCMGDLRTACLEKGWSNDQVDLLVDQIMASSRYAFNKSHAVSYAYVAYACAFLRHHYPIEWWTAILQHASKDDLKKFYPYCHKYILLPDVNKSATNWTLIDEGNEVKILAPLSLIDGVGTSAVDEIMRKKPFQSFDDFFTRVDKTIINRRIMQRLIVAGLLDPLFPQDFTELQKLNVLFEKRREVGFKDTDWDMSSVENSLFQKYINKRHIFSIFTVDWTEEALSLIRRNARKHGNKYIIDPYISLKFELLNDQTWFVSNDLLKGRKKDVLWCLMTADKLQEVMTFKREPGSLAFWGYVVKESDFTYQKNGIEHTARKYLVEIGTHVYELVKFPEWEQTHHGLDRSYEDDVVLFFTDAKWSPQRQEMQMYITQLIKMSL